jgi:hypothetical protein
MMIMMQLKCNSKINLNEKNNVFKTILGRIAALALSTRSPKLKGVLQM